jgi:sulfite exporter TauE/SafE
MIDALPALATALLAGFLGSAHCLGMCAGISGLFAAHVQIRSLSSRLVLAVSYNLGRMISYALLGLAVATLGSHFVAAIPAAAGPVRLLAGTIIVLIGLQIAFDWRLLQPLERMGSVLWQALSPLAKRLIPVTSLPRAFGLGLLWGCLPCGLVYSVLLVAAGSSRPLDGALVMLAFGLGTLPAMLATGLGAATLSRALQRRGTRLGLGLLIVVLGLLTLTLPLSAILSPTAQHQHG